MKLEDTWKSIEAESQTIDHNEVLTSIKNNKGDVMAKLQQKQIFKMIYAIVFTIGYSILLFFVTDLLVMILFGILIGVHIIAIVYFVKEYKGMKKLIPMDGNVKETLSSYLMRIKRLLRNEERAGLFLYPVAVSAGFFFALLSDRTLADISGERWIWVIWISVMVGFTPIGHWLAKKMNRIAFQKHLNKLQSMIDQIEELNTIND